MKKFLTLIVLVVNCSVGLAQKSSYVLELIFDEQQHTSVTLLKMLPERFSRIETALSRLENKISKLKEKGHIEANIDTVYYKTDTIVALVHIGKKYEWGQLKFSNFPQKGFGLNRTEGRVVNWNGLEEFHKSAISSLNNSGFPFASIEVENIVVKEAAINASWKINRGVFVEWDSIVTKGPAKIKSKFLQKYLGIKPGDAFEEDIAGLVSEKINNLSFVKEIKASEIEFGNGKARVYTYIEKQASNQFDGILGIQSNNDDSEKVELTGEVHLLLNNTFSSGEQIQLNWQKYQSKSQNLFLDFMYPYLFSTSLGLDFGFDIQKQDSTYLSTKFDLGIRFLQAGNNYLKLYWISEASSLISTNHLKSVSVLPEYADVKSNLWGFGYHFENLDYAFNPKRGWRIDLKLGTGKHKLKKNSNIPEELYTGIDLTGTLVNSGWSLEYNHPIINKLSYRVKNIGGIVDAPDLFANDLFKLGGISSIRGFNEDSFRASRYTVVRNELRFIPEKNSSFYLFWDGGYYKNKILGKELEDYPWGVGFGLNFGTKSGIFSLNYAIGKQKNQGLGFKEAKIHFGFTSRF